MSAHDAIRRNTIVATSPLIEIQVALEIPQTLRAIAACQRMQPPFERLLVHYAVSKAGSRGACASSISSQTCQIWSRVRLAAVCGSSMAA